MLETVVYEDYFMAPVRWRDLYDLFEYVIATTVLASASVIALITLPNSLLNYFI